MTGPRTRSGGNDGRTNRRIGRLAYVGSAIVLAAFVLYIVLVASNVLPSDTLANVTKFGIMLVAALLAAIGVHTSESTERL